MSYPQAFVAVILTIICLPAGICYAVGCFLENDR